MGRKKKVRVSKEPDLIREQKYLLHYFKRQVLCFSDASCFKNSFPQLFQDLSVLFYEIDFEDVISFTWSKLQIISHSFSKMMLRPGILSPWVLVQLQLELDHWTWRGWEPAAPGRSQGRHLLRGQRLPTIRAVRQQYYKIRSCRSSEDVTCRNRVLVFILLGVITAQRSWGKVPHFLATHT